LADSSPASGPTCDLAVHASYVALASAYAQGLRSGTAAATVDNPYFLGDHALIAAGWEVSRARSGTLAMRPLAEQEEYFVAWVHGYVVRAEQIEDAPAAWAAREETAEGDDPSAPVVAKPTTP
jgi:hypothetical protein